MKLIPGDLVCLESEEISDLNDKVETGKQDDL